jgi:hypothetical protein
VHSGCGPEGRLTGHDSKRRRTFSRSIRISTPTTFARHYSSPLARFGSAFLLSQLVKRFLVPDEPFGTSIQSAINMAQWLHANDR